MSNPIRWSGLAAFVGGILYALFMFFHPANEVAGMRTATWMPVHAMWLVATLLILLGLVGLHVQQAQQSGRPNLMGFLIAFFGTALLLADTWVETFIFPTLALRVPGLFEAPPASFMVAILLGYLLFVLGYVLLGISIARSGILPRWAGLLLAGGAPLFVVGAATVQIVAIIGAVLFGVGWRWLGYALLGSQSSASAQTAHVK